MPRAPARGTRYRLVTTTRNGRDTERHVSSVVLSADEAHEQLCVEAELAEIAGWTVLTLRDEHGGFPTVLCQRGATTRVLTIRERGALEDAL